MKKHKKLRCAVLFSGAGTTADALLDSASKESCSYSIELIITNNPQADGIALAARYGVELLILPDTVIGSSQWNSLLNARLAHYQPQLIVLAGFMRLIDSSTIDRWQGKIINIHPSLLPAWKGLDTHARALAAGDSEHGFSVHLVTPELDSGPLLAQYRLSIAAGDTAASLQQRVQIQEKRWYPLIIDWIAQGKFTLTMPVPAFNGIPLTTTGVGLCDDSPVSLA